MAEGFHEGWKAIGPGCYTGGTKRGSGKRVRVREAGWHPERTQHSSCHSERSEESQSASRSSSVSADGRESGAADGRGGRAREQELTNSNLALRSACIRGRSSACICVNAVTQG